VGGGASRAGSSAGRYVGRSPRGRRSLSVTWGTSAVVGSISAWAEEPEAKLLPAPSDRVDLRVGGGAYRSGAAAMSFAGRSPRGRRSRSGVARAGHGDGSISAWAEEPGAKGRTASMPWVDLRVGGGAASVQSPA